MEDVLLRAQSLVESFEAVVRAELPDGAEIFDAHVHLGNDIDGMVGDFDELLAGAGAVRDLARVHVLPRRARPASRRSRAANDRTLAFAERSGGRLVPFVRLDLTEDPIERGRRAASTPARAGSSCTRARRSSS